MRWLSVGVRARQRASFTYTCTQGKAKPIDLSNFHIPASAKRFALVLY